MTLIRFYGANDDLIDIEGPVIDPYHGMSDTAEFNNSRGNPGPLDFKGTFLIVDVEGVARAKVHAFYDGTWSFAVGMVDEDTPIPETWKFTTRPSVNCDYSMELVAEVDEGCHAMQPNGEESPANRSA